MSAACASGRSPAAAGSAASAAGATARAAWRRRIGTALLAVSTLSLLGGARPPDHGALVERFSGPNGSYVSADWFWSSRDRGRSRNPGWFAESGDLLRDGSAGRTSAPAFRMWTRRTDLPYATAAMDLRFEGWAGGSEGWHGINVWLNRTLCTPVPGCDAVDDKGGNSGYALDFLNRDGSLSILKQVSGDTRVQWPEDHISFTQGGTYYRLAGTTWTPVPGKRYRFSARAVDRGDATVLEVLVDGQVRLQAVDTGAVGGPRLTGGRVGLRSDHAELTVDNLTVDTSASSLDR